MTRDAGAIRPEHMYDMATTDKWISEAWRVCRSRTERMTAGVASSVVGALHDIMAALKSRLCDTAGCILARQVVA